MAEEMANVGLVMGWIVAFFLGALALIIICFILFKKTIDLSQLLSDNEGRASTSRLQFLIFTFLIATGLFIGIVSQDPPQLPLKIPVELFALLGISGGSYVVSKAIK